MVTLDATTLPPMMPASATPVANPCVELKKPSSSIQMEGIATDPLPPDTMTRQKHFEVLAAIRSNVKESQIDEAIKTRIGRLLDELDDHLGVPTFQAKHAALSHFAAAHGAVLFPIIGPLIDTLGDRS